MKGALSGLRRVAASLMLAALASFVLHGAAMAGTHRHGPASQDCAAVGHVHAEPASASHTHADGAAGSHQAHADLGSAVQDATGDHHAQTGDTACCSSICTIAITGNGPKAPSFTSRGADNLPFLDQDGSGADLSGLKRPPRTTDIA